MTAAGADSDPAAAWAAEARSRLRENGYRAGGARTAVIELLAREGGCLEAEHVAARLGREGRKVGTASVYRALGLLSELGLLHKVALPGAPVRFELVLPGGEHHHHIVCDGCGRTSAFSDERLEAAIEEVSRRAAFEVQAHDITLHGTCRECRAA
jgi:Fur family transcriptional regulator, ferric uptake regulator